MAEIICVDQKYSTTRCLTQEKPVIEQKPNDKFKSMMALPEGQRRRAEGGLRTKGYFKTSRASKPLISVITVVFNGDKFLEETVQSVISQTYDNVEYIIIDGGSTDGTLDIIKKYDGQLDYWVSERDKGIYDGMNKGVIAATGGIVAFLNSDDYYFPDVLTEVASFLTEDYLACGILKVYGNGCTKEMMPISKSFLPTRPGCGMPFPHPGLFVRSYVFKRIGLFDQKYRIAADMDFVFRMLLSGFIGATLQNIVVNFRDGGESSKLRVIFESGAIEYKAGVSRLSILSSFSRRALFYIINNTRKSVK